MGPANYGQHFLDFFWAPLPRSFLPVRRLRLIHELFKLVFPYEHFNLIFQATHVSVLCSISLWKVQFLFISFWALSAFMGSGDLYMPRLVTHRCGLVGWCNIPDLTDCPHIPTRVFPACFVLTRTLLGKTSLGVTHPSATPGQAGLSLEFLGLSYRKEDASC